MHEKYLLYIELRTHNHTCIDTYIPSKRDSFKEIIPLLPLFLSLSLYIYIFIYIYIYIYSCMYIYVRMCFYNYVYTYEFIYAGVLSIYIYIYMCVCVCVCDVCGCVYLFVYPSQCPSQTILTCYIRVKSSLADNDGLMSCDHVYFST